MFSLSKLTSPPHLPSSPAPWKQQFIDSNNYLNSCRQGTYKYRNMAITIILHNHFQKDNVKQIISNTKMFFKRNMTKLLKRRGKKRPLCVWCSRERHRTGSPEEAQSLTRQSNQPEIMPGNNPGCSRPLHPIQTTECGPCLTLGPVPTGQWRLFFPHKCTHWVVHLKKHFLKENSLL